MDIAHQILQFNADRDPVRLALKYQKMRVSPLAFFRGTCHLFYDRLSQLGVGVLPKKAPLVWACGDLHLENFGSYKGDNRQVYFDVNDFDEAALAPASWDLLRMVASIALGTQQAGLKPAQSDELCTAFLSSYAQALTQGKAYWQERDTAQGPVRALLESLRNTKRVAFLDARTEQRGGKRSIKIDGKKALAATAAERKQVREMVATFARTHAAKGFFTVQDVARRIAGNGSLGLERYSVLVKGKGHPDGNYLLDLKVAAPSCLATHFKALQPRWPSASHRIVALQSRLQAVPMAFLHPVSYHRTAFVLRALQPAEDRVAVASLASLSDWLQLIHSTGQLVAWAHLRGASRQGSASVDDLITFGKKDKWQPKLLAAAHLCAQQALADTKDFNAAYDSGTFTPAPRQMQARK